MRLALLPLPHQSEKEFRLVQIQLEESLQRVHHPWKARQRCPRRIHRKFLIIEEDVGFCCYSIYSSSTVDIFRGTCLNRTIANPSRSSSLADIWIEERDEALVVIGFSQVHRLVCVNLMKSNIYEILSISPFCTMQN